MTHTKARSKLVTTKKGDDMQYEAALVSWPSLTLPHADYVVKKSFMCKNPRTDIIAYNALKAFGLEDVCGCKVVPLGNGVTISMRGGLNCELIAIQRGGACGES